MTSQDQVERLGSLIGAAAAVVGEVDLDQVLRRLVIEARWTTGAQYAALGVLGAHGVLREFIYEGIHEEKAEQIGPLPQGRGVLGTVVRERKTIVLDDISDHPDSYGFPEHHPAMTNFLGVPVMAGNESFGNLYLAEKTGGFDDEDVANVEALALIAGSAVNTARLRDSLEQMAIVQDRNRIARDLHDSIIQDLFAIGLSLQSLSERVADDSSARLLDDSVDRLDEVVESLRSYIYDLKTHTKPTLEQTLNATIDRYRSAYPNEIITEVTEAVVVESLLFDQIELLLSESLSNALRHSGTGPIHVTLTTAESELILRVKDQGTGFDPAARTKGMGLAGMRDRVSRLGGELGIDSAPGKGATITISLPLS